MKSPAISYFVAGLLIGILIATAGFTWFVRTQHNSSSRGQTTVLKLGHTLDQNHPVHQSMLRMAEILRDKSNGTVELQIFPNSQLGSETECLEQLQRGALAMAKTSTAPIESFIPEMAIFGVPYAFRDEDQFWKFVESPLGRGLLDAGHSVGLRGLCYYDAGSRNFYTTRPINSPQDLQGLKLRVQKSKTAMDMVEALGGSPTPIAWGELYTALQQHMVDGAENNPPSFFVSRHFEICKYLAMDEHTRVPDMLLMSEKVWLTLTPQVQKWIQQAADESAKLQRQLWKAESQRVLEALEQEGVTVSYPDKGPFAALVAPMHRSFDGTRIGELLAAIQELK